MLEVGPGPELTGQAYLLSKESEQARTLAGKAGLSLQSSSAALLKPHRPEFYIDQT